MNTYGYVGGNPIGFVDFYGLATPGAGTYPGNGTQPQPGTTTRPIDIPIPPPWARNPAGAIVWGIGHSPDTAPPSHDMCSGAGCYRPIGHLNENANDDGKPKQCTDEEKKKKKEANCQALKQSILNTCAGLSGKKMFRCFAAAQKSYEQCMDQD